MTSFLKQLARHYFNDGTNLDTILFVLPSRRSIVFFRKYLSETARECGRTAILPQLVTMDEFMSSLSNLRKADRITLLLKLYDVYKHQCELNSIPCDALDDFIFWGDMILGDFSDVDKYLVDANDLFRNIAQYKSLQDDFSDLDEKQRMALETFLRHFGTGGEFKARFARTWNILGPVYEEFNKVLLAEGISYDGSMYRHIVGRLDTEGTATVFKNAFPDCDKVVFCGLNALNECEKKVLRAFKKLNLAEYCWDYCSTWIKDPENKSSFFLKDFVEEFRPAFQLENCDSIPVFEEVSVPSAIGQVKYLSSVLAKGEIPCDERTAIVLADENMLLPLLNSLPENVRNVNVTMGFPMSSSSFFSLMDDICRLQMNLRENQAGELSFYHVFVSNILNNNVFNAVATEQDKMTMADVRKLRRYYAPESLFKGSKLMELVFRKAQVEGVISYQEYLLDILDYIGKTIANSETLKKELALELDFAMEYSKAVTLIGNCNLEVSPKTYFKLLRALLQSTSIPFKGEPLVGLQIMGPLETRALDFEHVFILNASEGSFPRRSVASSFIPAVLRKGFGLPTYEYQDAVWAYYFYRLAQRPATMTFVLDSRTEGMRSGEESRYIKQLCYAFDVDVKSVSVAAPANTVEADDSIEKTEEHVKLVKSRHLSASAIKNYLTCPAKFYYSFIERLSDEDEIAESLDSGMTGNVFHKVMQKLYGEVLDADGEKGTITKTRLKEWYSDYDRISAMVEKEALEELGYDEIRGRDIVTCRMICKYILACIKVDINFLEEKNKESFTFYKPEQMFYSEFSGLKFKGQIDRIDSFDDGVLRVIDYKTGRVLPRDVSIDIDNASDIAESIFDPSSKEKPLIALQMYCYDRLLKDNGFGQQLVNCVYSTRHFLSEQPAEVIDCEEFDAAMNERFDALAKEILSTEVPFLRRENGKDCEYCDFKTICAR